MNLWSRLQGYLYAFVNLIWSLFLQGLLTVLPIILTLALFNVSFKFLKGWLEPIRRVCPPDFACIPHAEILLAIIIIFLIGTIIKVFMLRSLVHAIENVLFRVPIIRTVYRGIRQLVMAFNPEDNITFKEVVFIEFPRLGMYSLGFITSDLPKDLAPHEEDLYVTIFIPTTPMPTTGYFIIAKRKDLMHAPLTHQEAIALIISGGIIKPERYN